MNYDRSGNTNWNTMASLVYNIFFFFWSCSGNHELTLDTYDSWLCLFSFCTVWMSTHLLSG